MTPRDREYEALRREIEKLLELEHSLYSILYVGITAVLAWGISSENALICLLTYCIIFPAFRVLLSYNSGMLRIGAYMYVFYDEYLWEKQLYKICKSSDIKNVRYNSSFKAPFISVSILSTVLSLIICEFNIKICVLSLLLLIFFIIYSFNQGNCDTIKQKYIDEFKKIKNEEDNPVSNQSTQNANSTIPGTPIN